ncbi:hypothetical protein EAG_12914 [Camponotus floridanus]|uniref:Uncharacterized protein n=1 Tax=Camponotus floridanus TaxID=104421 RepID=E2ATU2_CAMFO|nr:hypothetical protein EAG_12914 [Camponotus floridanus]
MHTPKTEMHDRSLLSSLFKRRGCAQESSIFLSFDRKREKEGRRERTLELERKGESHVDPPLREEDGWLGAGSLESRKEGTGPTGVELDGTTLEILRRQRCDKDGER